MPTGHFLQTNICFLFRACKKTHSPIFHSTPRLTPKNVHQRPTVVLLCGPHIQGAQGVSCGRHLANHEVEVILFLPNFVKMQESISSEVSLYSRTSGLQVSSIKGDIICVSVPFCFSFTYSESEVLTVNNSAWLSPDGHYVIDLCW